MKRIYKLLSDVWAMRHQDYEGFISMVMTMMANNPGALAALFDGNDIKSYAVAPVSGNIADIWDVDDTGLPDNSIAVFNLRGVLTGGQCERLARAISMAEANDRICGIVIDVDGPGGSTSHLESAARAIAECSKPIATVVTGCMCSAHFWLGTSAQRTFIESPMCEVGCVGALIRYQDYEGLYNKLGIKTTEIYATGSDLKNAEVRKLEEGDDTLLRDRADFINKLFCGTVSKNLGIAYDAELPLFRGQTFFAEDAINLGYIDQWGGVDEAVRWVLGKSAAAKANNFY